MGCKLVSGLPASPATCRQSGGFALIVVLWVLVLIAFIVAHLTATGRTEMRIASNLTANAVAQAAADGAIFEAIFNLSDPRPEQRWPVDGTAHAVAIGNSRVMVQLEDEAYWINPSTASPPLLEALLRVTGSDPASAHELAIAISEWVGSASAARPQQLLLGQYRAAGLDYGPPGGPIESLGELGSVIGMTPTVLASIRPHLTLFGPPEPSPMTTDPIVAAALALLAPQAGAATPLANQPPPDLLTVRITALASGPGNARVHRTAVVRVGPALPRGYSVLAWGQSLDSSPAPTASAPAGAVTR
jgi:general secretion pathway protein K